MNTTTRRTALWTLGAGAAALGMPSILRAETKPRVVVLGGGAGGATAARYIAKDSKGALDVTLIDAAEKFTTCFFSNLYLGGFRDFDSITHGYDTLESSYGIAKVTAYATAIDRNAKQVILADGGKVPYDRLVVSPGISLLYDSVPGYSEALSEAAPHAWKAGRQTQILKEKLDALEDGQNVVMLPPPNPYRCPPGPYERASMMAHLLSSKGLTNSKVVILDVKEKFSKKGLFLEGWENHYPGMVEWYGPDIHGGIKHVDVAGGTVETDLDTFKGALLNIIPAQRAGEIAQIAGLTDDSGFCPIDPASMRSQADPNIFVIGDASIAGDMPKSAFSANSQAKVASMTVRADLLGSKLFPAKYANTCWSLIATDDSVKVGGQYAPGDGKIASTAGFISQMHEEPERRQANYEESVGWYKGIVSDMFG